MPVGFGPDFDFAIVGASGYIAPRHLQAIRDVGGRLVAALDPHDAAGALDKNGYAVEFFTAPERFERYLYRLRREGRGIDWLTVCSPNHMHDAHSFMGLRNGADVICEKPLALTPYNLDALEDMERETGKRIYTVLQLRLHPKLIALKTRLDADPRPRTVDLRYTTPRGFWYHRSWKGDVARSGGLITNIGIHLLDTLLWLFGSVEYSRVTSSTAESASGMLQCARARVTWELCIDPAKATVPERRLTVYNDPGPDDAVEFTDGFAGLHTKVYEETLAGRGFGIADARPAVELAYRLRNLTP